MFVIYFEAIFHWKKEISWKLCIWNNSDVYKMFRYIFVRFQYYHWVDKGNNKITELRTILQRESKNS